MDFTTIYYPWDDDAGDTDPHFGSFEELVAQIDSIPKGDEIFLDLRVVSIVEPVSVVVDDNQNFRIDGSRSAAFQTRRANFPGRR